MVLMVLLERMAQTELTAQMGLQVRLVKVLILLLELLVLVHQVLQTLTQLLIQMATLKPTML